MTSKPRAVGTTCWRVDGIGKVTGRALFGDDVRVPGMLHGAVLLSRRAHARILSIDTSRARSLEGVRAVLTADDLPHARTFGVVIRNQPVLAGDRVRYWGDAVAVVAAGSPQVARRAADLVRVEYEDLPAVFDPLDAMRDDAPPIHGDSNLVVHHRVRKGDIVEGFERAGIVIENRFTTQHVEHSYIEPESVLVLPLEDGGIEVVGCIQNLFSTRRSLSDICGLDLNRVVVNQSAIGGSFGGKDEVMTQIAARAALLALATGRPVKLTYSREESMAQSYKRHPYVLDYKLGALEDGTLTAMQITIHADAGAYASMTPFVTWRSAVQATGPYVCPNVKTDVYGIYTNNCYTGAMRGFGSPQVNLAIESLIDELATRIEADPLDLRMKIGFEDGATTATGQVLSRGVSLKEVLVKASEFSGWRAKKGRPVTRGGRRRGIGLSCSYRGVSLGAEGVDATGSVVSVQTDGSVIVATGVTEMGQGAHTTMAIIAAEVLGVDVSRVRFAGVRTDRVPDSGPTVASRATIMFGQSVRKAAAGLRETLLEVASEILDAPANDLELADGRASVVGQPSRSIDFNDLAREAFSRGRSLTSYGWHRAPETSWHEENGTGDAYFTFVYGANVAEVEVDTETGKIDVLSFTSVHDVGRAINPRAVRSQIYGGVAMGIGYGVLEDYHIEEGVPAQHNFDEYLLLTSMDMPDVRAEIVENPDESGPFGAKSIGEPAAEIAAPAVLNAVHDATGKRITTLPADLETVLLGRKLRRDAPRGSGRDK